MSKIFKYYGILIDEKGFSYSELKKPDFGTYDFTIVENRFDTNFQNYYAT
jgi:hypothetical protein